MASIGWRIVHMLQTNNNVWRIGIGKRFQQIRLLEWLAFFALEIPEVKTRNGLGDF